MTAVEMPEEGGSVELEKAQPSFDVVNFDVVKRMARVLGGSLDTLAKEEDAPPPPKRATRQAAPVGWEELWNRRSMTRSSSIRKGLPCSGDHGGGVRWLW